MVILWRLVLLENELRAQFCIDFGCCLFWAFSLFLIIQTFKVRFLLSPISGYELSFSPSQLGFPTQLGQKKGGMNASLFVNIVKRQAANINDPISLQKGWVAHGRATGSYKMMPLLGIRVQACKQDSYSEKDRNQTSGQNIPPYKMRGCCKELVDAQSPFVWRNVYLHPFIL